MKKVFIYTVIAFCTFTVKAQFTLNHTDLPQPGDTFALRYSHTPDINFGSPSSEAQHFDFSDLEFDSLKFATYGITSEMDFADEFPESNLFTYGPSVMYGGPGSTVPTLGWGWMLFRTDEDGMDIIGYRMENSPQDIIIKENPPLKLIKTPCTYGDIFSPTSHWTQEFSEVASDPDTVYKSHKQVSLNCDAWGTISTPIDENLEVIRINEFKITVDSIYAKVAGNIVWKGEFKRDTSNTYMFFATEKRHPVVTVFCKHDNSIIGAEYLYYSKLYNAIEKNNSHNIKIFPNPANKQIWIENGHNSQYEIYDLEGKIVLLGKMDSDIIDISRLKTGFYLIKLAKGQNRYSASFIKQ
ncbi:MAG: T9SS type A sorting domain-containing protein [Bacteroidales bacterium]